MPRKSKLVMLSEMKDYEWPVSCTIDDDYDTVKEEYEIFLDEISSDSDLFPNGRDYDAEDEDGPF